MCDQINLTNIFRKIEVKIKLYEPNKKEDMCIEKNNKYQYRN